jgi:hypothetical protein
MGAQGSAVVNFGTGALEASVVITGQAAFTAGTNLVEAWALANETVGTQNNDACWVEQIQVYAIRQITGTGWTILAKPAVGKAFGSYNVGWVYN